LTARRSSPFSIRKAGRVSIILLSNVTARIEGGVFNDAFRTTIAGDTATLFIGPISVIENPDLRIAGVPEG
jgi:hypothetical protein